MNFLDESVMNDYVFILQFFVKNMVLCQPIMIFNDMEKVQSIFCNFFKDTAL